uniref:NAD-capped RNA hydrolase NUDT12 n=1 Tax=Neogobius melanostomus TaxID=47308 RepID=A0A8C6WTA3_9GOBI
MFGGERAASEELLERFLDAAACGDLALVTSLLSNAPSLLNRAGTNGWTALMLAARNGHHGLVGALLQHGCDKSLLNRSSQSAFDVAKFWGHTHICRLLLRPDPSLDPDQLSSTPVSQEGKRWIPPQSPHETYFSAEPLDRLSAKRPDQDWVRSRLKGPQTVILLFHRLSPMMRDQDGDQEGESSAMQSRLCRFSHKEVEDLLERPGSVLVFLGVERRRPPPSAADGEPRAWFALGLDSESEEELLKRSCEKHSRFAQNAHRDLLRLSEEEAGVVAQARSVLAWHSRYSHCSTCGSVSRVEEAGHKRSCESQACISHKGVHNTCYPRVDPVVIMLVVHPDQSQVLLGRKKVFPSGMFSCLAGFIEPGECVEAAVRREVQEESGVLVGPVWYVCSQPWPMPSSLMIGCLTVAMTTEINVDQEEIEEAQWFTRQQVVDSLLGGPRAAFTVPPRQTIAHQLLRHWTGLSANL